MTPKAHLFLMCSIINFAAGLIIGFFADFNVSGVARRIDYVQTYNKISMVVAFGVFIIIVISFVIYELVSRRLEKQKIELRKLELEENEIERIKKRFEASNKRKITELEEMTRTANFKIKLAREKEIELKKLACQIEKMKNELKKEVSQFNEWLETAIATLKHRKQQLQKSTNLKNAERIQSQIDKILNTLEKINVSNHP